MAQTRTRSQPDTRPHNCGRRISLTERSARAISADVFSELQRQPSFNKLLQTGVLNIVVRGAGSFELVASHYLGAAQLENSWTIEIVEKSHGTLRGLFEELSNARYKLPDTSINAHVDGAVFLHIAESFLCAVEKYVVQGRYRQYLQKSFPTSRPSGRLDVKGTIRHITRGSPSTAQVTSFQLTPNILPNQIIAYCLAEIEALALRNLTTTSLLHRARTLFLLFGDVQYREFSRIDRATRARQLSTYLGQNALRLEMRRALELAYPLFVGGGLFGVNSENFSLQSLFVDMEFLFEQSVLKTLQQGTGLVSASGASTQVTVFAKGSRRYKCEPDIVLSTEEKIPVAIGDVKYKTLDKTGPVNSDIYQLLTHANAFGVSNAFLIFPGDAFSHTLLGNTRAGIAVSIFTVRPGNLLSDARAVTEAICALNS